MSKRRDKKHASEQAATAPAGLAKKLLLSVAATVVFFVLLELLLALVGVAPERYADDPYVGFSSLSPLFVEQTDADGSAIMVIADNKRRLFNEQAFPKLKADGVTRVFCVGGSTTYGRPYDDTTSFCGWLRELLPVADPSRRWDVINAGGISYASYRVAALMEELVHHRPDLFIIYSGHNEFLERRSYSQIIAMPPALRGLGSLSARTRTHAAMRGLMEKISLAPQAPTQDAANLLDEEVTTLLDESVGPEAYERDDELRDRVLEHYRFNLARMVDIAASVGARTLLVTPASNLRHCAPFKSQHRDGLENEQQQQWQMHMGQVRKAVAARDVARAVHELEMALGLDDRHAWTQYLAGQTFDVVAEPERAKAAYERARDEDVCPLRALGAMRDIVLEVAADRQAPVADFVAAVESISKDRVAGNELFLDHVHPTVGGNRLLALTIMGTMGKAGLLDFDPRWGQEAVDEITRRVEGSLDAGDHGLALMKLSKVMGWAGKLNESHTLARRAVALLPDDSRVQYQAGLTADLLQRTDEAILHYRRAVEIQPTADLPHGNLGVALEKKGQLGEAIEHYRLAVAHGSGASKQRNSQNLAMALARMAAVDLERGRYRAGASSLGEALELSPEDARLHNLMAIALWESERHDDARRHHRRALALDPELEARGHDLAAYLRKSGRQSEADSLADSP